MAKKDNDKTPKKYNFRKRKKRNYKMSTDSSDSDDSDWDPQMNEQENDVDDALEFQKFLQNRNKAYQVLNVGEKPRDKNIFSVKAAAMTMVANTLINHNETFTRR